MVNLRSSLTALALAGGLFVTGCKSNEAGEYRNYPGNYVLKSKGDGNETTYEAKIDEARVVYKETQKGNFMDIVLNSGIHHFEDTKNFHTITETSNVQTKGPIEIHDSKDSLETFSGGLSQREANDLYNSTRSKLRVMIR